MTKEITAVLSSSFFSDFQTDTRNEKQTTNYQSEQFHNTIGKS
jgi:hypothetical protein